MLSGFFLSNYITPYMMLKKKGTAYFFSSNLQAAPEKHSVTWEEGPVVEIAKLHHLVKPLMGVTLALLRGGTPKRKREEAA